MLELTPQERAKLRYIQLFEEQILWNQRKQEESFLDKFIKWLMA